jgi:FkbM family methyltransferase
MRTAEIRSRLHWRSLVTGAAASFVRRVEAVHGFYRISRLVRLMVRKAMAGSYCPVSYFDGVIWIDAGNDLDSAIFSKGIYEPGTISIIRDLSSRGFSYIDVGCYIGTHLLAALQAKRDETQVFVGFEPVPETRSVLMHNLAKNGFEHGRHVQIHACGLGASTGRTRLYVSLGKNPQNNGIIPRNGYQQAVCECDVVRLDDRVASALAPRILVKIDAEGSEPAILDGASGLLQSGCCVVLVIEHNVPALRLAGQPREAVCRRLAHYGYKTWKIDEPTGRLSAFFPEREEFCNFFAARELPSCLQSRLAAPEVACRR